MNERRDTPVAFGPLRVEQRDDQPAAIVGLAAVYYDPARSDQTTYTLWDNVVERIEPGAFDRAVAERQDVRGVFNHNPENLLGRVSSGTLELFTDSRGLNYRIAVDPGDPDHARVTAKLDRGDLSGSSFMFRATEVEWSEDEQSGAEVRTIKDVDLYDVGPVTNPAYQGTTAGLRQAGDHDEIRAELEAFRARKDIPILTLEAARQRQRVSEM